ncbi:MAG: NUDIX hydrolase [Actinomycetes bacterium]
MPVPDFILALRRKIGHDLLWLPGVTAVVTRGEGDDGEVLLVRRSDNRQWTPVTGIVDPGEHPALAAAREVLEETGVTCEVGALAGVDVSPRIVHANGDHAQYLNHTYRCHYVSGDAHVADDESVDVQWFRLAALPVMAEAHQRRIDAATGRVDVREGA